MSGRYPQASNLNEFWENLKAGKDCITQIPEDRWDANLFEGFQLPSGKFISKWGGFIDDANCFDNKFFRISPQEAVTLDPQERLFLEVCWEAMEDAGYTPNNIVSSEGENQRRPVGVFVGVMHKDYTLLQNEAVYEGEKIPLTLNDASIANRVSYVCNFHGPSIAIDTMCSSSLTAVHLAMDSLIKGESKVAFAGGVNLSLHPNKYLTYGIADIHSSDSHCHTFGEGGDGYVSAEGIGAVLLKPLQQAIADGDSIYAVLKGSTVNHGGAAGGFTIPSPVAQGSMIADCLKKTGIDPESIGYIEAHGTGTSLGDPIEIQGLNRAFREFTSSKQFCAVGSVKSNIGHAEGAAGISGLTKTILQLHHKTLVKSLHSDVINPYLDLPSSPFYVQTETRAWDSPETKPRRAGVSAFGATGSNAHIILEEFPSNKESSQSRVEGGVLLPISAKNLECLQEYAKRILLFLQDHPETDLASLAYTLQTGRVEMEERLILYVTSIEEATQNLTDWLMGIPPLKGEQQQKERSSLS
jgi:acyl transferase domain-containing protein